MPRLDLTDRFCRYHQDEEARRLLRRQDYRPRAARVADRRQSMVRDVHHPWNSEAGAALSSARIRRRLSSRARTLAIEARGKVEAGEDPRLTGEVDAAMTVGGLVEAYLAKKKGIKTCRELGRRLRADVVPVIGTVKLADLHRRDVHRVLDPILERGAPVAATKAFGDLRAMLRWAVERGYLDHDPMLGMKVKKAKPRERFLSRGRDRRLVAGVADRALGETWRWRSSWRL